MPNSCRPEITGNYLINNNTALETPCFFSQTSPQTRPFLRFQNFHLLIPISLDVHRELCAPKWTGIIYGHHETIKGLAALCYSRHSYHNLHRDDIVFHWPTVQSHSERVVIVPVPILIIKDIVVIVMSNLWWGLNQNHCPGRSKWNGLVFSNTWKINLFYSYTQIWLLIVSVYHSADYCFWHCISPCLSWLHDLVTF